MFRTYQWLAAALVLGCCMGAVDAKYKNSRRRVISSPYNPTKKPLRSSHLVTIKEGTGPGARKHRHVTGKAYKDLREGTLELLRRYDPRTHFFIGMGRDPAPIIAFLQNLGGHDLAINFPASGSSMGYGVAQKTRTFAQYFKKLVPPHVLKGRHLVLIDETSSGKTLKGYGAYFSKRLKTLGSRAQVKKVAFSGSMSHISSSIDVIDTTSFPDMNNYPWNNGNDPGFEGVVAEYEKHYMNLNQVGQMIRRPEYDSYKHAVQRRMQRDKKLHKFILDEYDASDVWSKGRLPPRWLPRFSRFKPSGKKLKKGPLVKLEAILETPHPALDGRPPLKVPTSFKYLSESEYQQLRDAALSLLESDSPRDAYFVGVGAAARPLVSVLRQLGSHVATHLPLDWSEGSSQLAKQQVSAAFADGKAVRRNKVFQSLDAALPAGALRGNRKIVVFRPTRPSRPGGMLSYAKSFTENFLQSSGAGDVAVQAVAIAPKKTVGSRHVDSGAWREVESLNLPKYQFAGQDAKSYQAFEKVLIERLRADPKIAQVVAKLKAKQPITAKADTTPGAL